MAPDVAKRRQVGVDGERPHRRKRREQNCQPVVALGAFSCRRRHCSSCVRGHSVRLPKEKAQSDRASWVQCWAPGIPWRAISQSESEYYQVIWGGRRSAEIAVHVHEVLSLTGRAGSGQFEIGLSPISALGERQSFNLRQPSRESMNRRAARHRRPARTREASGAQDRRPIADARVTKP